MRSVSDSADISMLKIAADLLRAERGVLRDVDRERGLAHGGAARHDDQIAGLQARGHFIELLEARWRCRSSCRRSGTARRCG